jgi:precorrin-3B methylase
MVDQSLVKQDSEAFKIVPTVASYSGAAFHLDEVQALHDFVVVELSQLFTGDLQIAGAAPGSHNFVILFVVADWNIWTDDVADFVELLSQLFLEEVSLHCCLCDQIVKGPRFLNFFLTKILAL